MNKVKIDVVIPICNEQKNLDELNHRLCRIFEKLDNIEWSLIYVNDGSTDESLKMMIEQSTRDQRIRIVDLSRNFGHQPAIAAGLADASGDGAIIMDGDLQDPPECIIDLVDAWKEGIKIVRAHRRSRREKGIRRIGFELFHWLFGLISDFPVHLNTGIYGLIDKEVVVQLNRFTERNRFFPGLRSWIGFEQSVVYYDRMERKSGKPSQSLRKLFFYAFDAIFSFSYKPLRLMTIIGLCISLVSFCLALIYIVKRLAGMEIAQTGFTTLVTLILFMGGVQLIAFGLLGEYLARIYDEVKSRPLYIVKKRYGVRRTE